MGIIVPFNHFDGTRDAIRPLERIDNIREAAKDFRETMLSKPKVLFYKTFELIRLQRWSHMFEQLKAYL